ncbi:MAG: DUF2651 family protein [Clostridia bacterium]|nr:DUF2651 family protein [Clostridia bacterium]
MNTLLIFFALPLATIILAVVLQKLIKSPILVAAIFFAIYLIIAFAVFNATFLVAAIVYTFLAYVTAAIVKIICCFLKNWNCHCMNQRNDNCYIRNTNATNNIESLNGDIETFNLSNTNNCMCQVSCRKNTREFNNGYNRGYNNGYDNAYNFISNNGGIATNENNTNNPSCCCMCNRRRCRIS